MDSLAAIIEEDMRRQANEICKFLENEFKKQYGSVPVIKEKLINIREAKNILKTEHGFQKSFENFAEKIQLHPSIGKGIIESYQKLDFCQTLSQEVSADVDIAQKVITTLS